jgi:curved DNA-binding protein CbpA
MVQEVTTGSVGFATMPAGPMTPRLLPYSPERDVYRLLGVPATASIEEVQAACRRLARTFHPDRNDSARATAEMQVVNVVRRVMTDPDERARYDRERRRFHEELVRPGPARLHARAPAGTRPDRRSPTARYLRAGLLGLRATLAGLAPSRCRICRTVIETDDDMYCAACGTPRLTGG